MKENKTTHAQPVEGILDGWLLSKVQIDWTKVDKPALKGGMRAVLGSIKPAITVPFDLDDKMLDGAVDMLENLIDNVFKKADGQPDGPITFAAKGTFTADNIVERYGCDDKCAAMLRNSPRLVGMLNELDEPIRAKVAISSALLLILKLVGPALIGFFIDRYFSGVEGGVVI